MVFRIKQKTFCVKTFLKTGSYKLVQKLFKTEFNTENRRHFAVPSKSRIHAWLKKFENFGSLNNRSSNDSGRPRQVRIPDNIQALEKSVEEDPETSLRKRAQEIGNIRCYGLIWP